MNKRTQINTQRWNIQNKKSLKHDFVQFLIFMYIMYNYKYQLTKINKSNFSYNMQQYIEIVETYINKHKLTNVYSYTDTHTQTQT